VSDSSWMKYWENYIFLNIVVSIIIIVWFTVGGISDLKHMISSLQSDHRDHGDDGWVHRNS